MTVQSRPTTEPKRQPPQIGIIPPGAIERAFIALLYLMILLLALLSVVGTFYGMRGESATLSLKIVTDITAALGAFGLALLVQVILTLVQWGARQLARRDPRWWLLYLAALGLSVYYNLVAWYAPALAAGSPWLLAFILIIAGDIIPEFVAVRHRR